MSIATILAILLWVYILFVLKRGKLDFWYFITGSVGMFVFYMILLQPVLTVPLQKAVAAVSGIIGESTGMFESYFEQGILFVESDTGAISMYIDYECSGIIEIGAYLSLLVFFGVYSFPEKIVLSVLGSLGVFCANILRIVVISGMIHVCGSDIYFIAHTIVGRIVFYGFTIILYFYVFTRGQIKRQRIGIIPVMMEIIPAIVDFAILLKRRIAKRKYKELVYMPEISLIIPVYNSADSLERCIESVYNSDYDLSKIYVMLVDNGSKDNSYEIFCWCREKFPKLTMVWETSAQGKSKALNKALYNSSGKDIIHIDSDGILHPQALRNMVQLFENELDIHCVTGTIYDKSAND